MVDALSLYLFIATLPTFPYLSIYSLLFYSLPFRYLSPRETEREQREEKNKTNGQEMNCIEFFLKERKRIDSFRFVLVRVKKKEREQI